jgi:CxxC-x17-CxxC domain-containing protein
MAPVYAAADDPNGYRAPGFQSEARGSYTVDYAGLPRDEEPNGNTREVGADRLGMRAPIAAGTARRGRNGHPGDRFASTDRAGTDPNAYRSPGFASPQRDTRSTAPRDPKKSRRMRHEATCADCGVAALVPFQPGPDRPAFCKDCYQVRKANGTVPRPTAALTPVPPAGNAEDNSSGSTADVATE